VAWIRLDGTHIDYPVMQSGDNRWFLSHDIYGRDSSAGSVFLDCRNQMDFQDDISIIYGHRMNGELMFSDIAKYADASFIDRHRDGELWLKNGKKYRLRVLEFRRIEADDAIYRELILSGANRGAIILSTCNKAMHEKRDVIILEKEEIKNDREVIE
jgi:sortase B